MYDDIILLVKLINSGRFANLAKKMGVAQSTISRKMELLERKLGVKLLKRDSLSFELTGEGQILYQNFKECEQNLAQLISPIYKNTKTAIGTLKILLPESFSHYAITPYLVDFAKNNPMLDLCLCYDFHNVNMSKDDYDIAIIPYVPNQTTQIIKQVNSCKIIMVCSSIYVEKYGFLDDLSRLDEHLIVGKISIENSIAKKIKFFHEKTNVAIELYNPSHLMANSYLEVKTMLKSNMLISALPEDLVQRELANGEFIRVLPDYNLGWLTHYMLRNMGNEDQRYKIFATFIYECIQRLKIK